MAITGVLQVTTTVDDLAVRVDEVQTVLRENALDGIIVADLLVALQGILDEGRQLMADTAELDELTLGVALDGRRTIQLWQWRRRTRFSLVLFVGEVKALFDVVTEFAMGFDERTVVTIEGDTLQIIAARELGDWQEWPRLVERNEGLSPITLTSGTTIVIPRRR